MINYAYEYLFKQDSVDKQINIEYSNGSITNTEMVQNTFKITESLCSETQLKFGCCEASKVEFTVGYGEVPLSNETLTISISPDGEDALQLGVYDVISDTPTADRKRRKIVAVDKMYQIINAEVIEWYNALFPTEDTVKTIKQIRDSFFDYIGIEQEPITLPLDNMQINKTITAESLSGKDVITAICEANLIFGHITRYGKFRYIMLQPIGESLFPDEELYPANDLYPKEGAVDEEIGVNGNYISATYEDYYTDLIDKFQVRTEENDIGFIEGTGTNAYIIEGNFLLYGKSHNELASIYTGVLNYIGQLFFTPSNIVAQGNPCLEAGDRIRLHTRYATIDTYILQRTMTGIQAIRDNYVSTSPKQRSEQVNSTNHSLLAILGKTNTLTRTVDETNSKIGYVAPGTTVMSTIQQTADSIDEEIEQIWATIDGNTDYYEGYGVPTFTQDADGTVHANYPACDWSTSIPCDGTIQLDAIYNKDMTVGGNEYPHWWFTEENLKEHMRALYVDLESGNGYRFVLTNGVWNWQLIADSDFAILFNQIAALRIDVGNIDLEVQEQGLEVEDHETRITTNSANINLQADEISARVKSEDSNASNTFSWALKTSGFDVKSNGNSVFKVNSGGAEINGKVTAKSGFIGNGSSGFTITNTSIYNGKPSIDSSREGVYIGTNGISLGDAESGEDFKVTPDGTIKATHGKIGAFELYRLNTDGSVGGLSYKDSSGRWGSIVGGVIPTGRTGKGLLIDGGKLYIGITNALSIYRENHPEEDDIFTFGYDNGHTYINSRWMFGNNNHLELVKNTQINADLTVTGAKNRVISTKDYGRRLLYSLECPSPLFEDVGESVIEENGRCEIEIDPIFAETILTQGYQVFLQAYGKGECYVSERNSDSFVVEGTPGLSFGWRLIAKQIDMTDKRLEPFE